MKCTKLIMITALSLMPILEANAESRIRPDSERFGSVDARSVRSYKGVDKSTLTKRSPAGGTSTSRSIIDGGAKASEQSYRDYAKKLVAKMDAFIVKQTKKRLTGSIERNPFDPVITLEVFEVEDTNDGKESKNRQRICKNIGKITPIGGPSYASSKATRKFSVECLASPLSSGRLDTRITVEITANDFPQKCLDQEAMFKFVRDGGYLDGINKHWKSDVRDNVALSNANCDLKYGNFSVVKPDEKNKEPLTKARFRDILKQFSVREGKLAEFPIEGRSISADRLSKSGTREFREERSIFDGNAFAR